MLTGAFAGAIRVLQAFLTPVEERAALLHPLTRRVQGKQAEAVRLCWAESTIAGWRAEAGHQEWHWRRHQPLAQAVIWSVS